MAIFRDDPYRAFNFRVTIEGADGDGPLAGFCEVAGLSAQAETVEYRAGNEKATAPRKLVGLTHYGDVTLRRGIVGSTDLWEWFRATRDGAAQARTVLVELLSADRAAVAMTWKLTGCLPVR